MGLMGRGCMETTEGRPCSRPQAGPEPASPQLPWQPAEVPGAAQGLQPSLCHRGRGKQSTQGRWATGAPQKGARPPWGVAKTVAPSSGGSGPASQALLPPYPLGTAADCGELQAPAMVPVGDKAAGPSAKRRGTAGRGGAHCWPVTLPVPRLQSILPSPLPRAPLPGCAGTHPDCPNLVP